MSNMPVIRFVDDAGTIYAGRAEIGSSVMRAAIHHAVPGIEAECGGACACTKCHVHVANDWWDKVGPPNAVEAGMLEFVADRRDTSRLSCQIRLQPYLDGLVVHLPQGLETP